MAIISEILRHTAKKPSTDQKKVTSSIPKWRMYDECPGCPVVVGNKWIANKWVRWHGQMWTHPCSRRRGEPFYLDV